MEKTINVLSYGGGINSSALFFYLIKNKISLDLVIFADTGEESDYTLDTVERMKTLCHKLKVLFIIVKSKYGNLYDYYFKKKSVMSIVKRDCTGKFKIGPIRQYLRRVYGKKVKFLMYIGIASEEWHRIKNSNVKYITNVYPFVDNNINRIGNRKILYENNFIAYKSGCKGCPFQKKSNWEIMIKNDPLEFKRWRDLETNNKRYPEILLNGTYSLTILETAMSPAGRIDIFARQRRFGWDVFGDEVPKEEQKSLLEIGGN